MKTIIHVARQALAGNRDGVDDPALIVRTHRGSVRCREVEIEGVVRVRQAGDGLKPLRCGARAWIETTGVVRPRQRRT